MRKLATIKCIATVFGIAVTGCSPDRARYTVGEYRADATLRHSQIETCKDDPGSLSKTPDCINARQAAVLEDRVRLRDMPPVGLSGKYSRKSNTNSKPTEAAEESPAPAH